MATAKKKAAPLPPVTERIQTMEDVLADNGHTPESFAEWCKDLSIDEIGYREAKFLARTFNEGEVMETRNTDQRKHFPWFWVEQVKKSKKEPSGFRLSYCGYVYTRTRARASVPASALKILSWPAM